MSEPTDNLKNEITGLKKAVERIETKIDNQEKNFVDRLQSMEDRLLNHQTEQQKLALTDKKIQRTADEANKKASKALATAGKYSFFGLIGGFFAQLLSHIFSK